VYLRHATRRKDGKTHTYGRLVRSVRRSCAVLPSCCSTSRTPSSAVDCAARAHPISGFASLVRLAQAADRSRENPRISGALQEPRQGMLSECCWRRECAALRRTRGARSRSGVEIPGARNTRPQKHAHSAVRQIRATGAGARGAGPSGSAAIGPERLAPAPARRRGIKVGGRDHPLPAARSLSGPAEPAGL